MSVTFKADMSGITRVGPFPKMNYEITLDAMRVVEPLVAEQEA